MSASHGSSSSSLRIGISQRAKQYYLRLEEVQALQEASITALILISAGASTVLEARWPFPCALLRLRSLLQFVDLFDLSLSKRHHSELYFDSEVDCIKVQICLSYLESFVIFKSWI